jgi:hypothetical protein
MAFPIAFHSPLYFATIPQFQISNSYLTFLLTNSHYTRSMPTIIFPIKMLL